MGTVYRAIVSLVALLLAGGVISYLNAGRVAGELMESRAYVEVDASGGWLDQPCGSTSGQWVWQIVYGIDNPIKPRRAHPADAPKALDLPLAGKAVLVDIWGRHLCTNGFDSFP